MRKADLASSKGFHNYWKSKSRRGNFCRRKWRHHHICWDYPTPVAFHVLLVEAMAMSRLVDLRINSGNFSANAGPSRNLIFMSSLFAPTQSNCIIVVDSNYLNKVKIVCEFQIHFCFLFRQILGDIQPTNMSERPPRNASALALKLSKITQK
jgi:hypothetical protein